MLEHYSIEKREAIRFAIAIPLKYARTNLKDITGISARDISANGLGLVTVEELPINAPLNLCLKMPDNGEEINLEAEVVWSQHLDTNEYRCGLRLKNIQLKPIPLVLRTIYAKLES